MSKSCRDLVVKVKRIEGNNGRLQEKFPKFQGNHKKKQLEFQEDQHCGVQLCSEKPNLSNFKNFKKIVFRIQQKNYT